MWEVLVDTPGFYEASLGPGWEGVMDIYWVGRWDGIKAGTGEISTPLSSSITPAECFKH